MTQGLFLLRACFLHTLQNTWPVPALVFQDFSPFLRGLHELGEDQGEGPFLAFRAPRETRRLGTPPYQDSPPSGQQAARRMPFILPSPEKIPPSGRQCEQEKACSKPHGTPGDVDKDSTEEETGPVFVPADLLHAAGRGGCVPGA